jgi:glucose-1-phosphate thymidylyltransferase
MDFPDLTQAKEKLNSIPMIAIILCAGFATRMYPLTRDVPKPLLPVADKPVIEYLMDQLVELRELQAVHIVSNARFSTHFEKWREHYIQIAPQITFQIEIHNDGAETNENRLGASADLQLVLTRIPAASKILVSAGDNIYRFSIKSLWQKFLVSPHHYVVALPQMDESKLKITGVLELDAQDRVLRQHEKPDRPQSTWSCPPLYFLQAPVRPRLEAFLNSSGNHDAPGYFIDYLCQTEIVYAFKLNAARLDIGGIESYREADRMMRAELSCTQTS